MFVVLTGKRQYDNISSQVNNCIVYSYRDVIVIANIVIRRTRQVWFQCFTMFISLIHMSF